MKTSLELVDLKLTRDVFWKDAFAQFIQELPLKRSQDLLIKNYLQLDKKWPEYDVFNLLVQDDKIMGFSGMHTSPYPQNIARVLSRLYYATELRRKDLAGHSLPSYAARLMLPYQIKRAQELGKDVIFLSFQELRRRRFCQKMAEVLREQYQQDWYLDDNMVNTARRLPNGKLNMDRSVWQNAIVLKLNPLAKFDLPCITLENWNQKFSPP